MVLLYVLIPFFAWIAFAKFWLHHHFTPKELVVQVVVTIAMFVGLFTISDSIQMGSTKIVNGAVTQLNPVKKSCPWGWVRSKDDHCTHYDTRVMKVGETCSTNSEGRRSCTDINETQYNYIYRWERRYFVESDVPKTLEIDRVDRQGVNTPPRFAQIQIGDPVAVEQSYKNYIKGAAHSLYRTSAAEPVGLAYPRVFDYYHANRVITFGDVQTRVDTAAWNAELAKLNRDVRSAGANVIIVLTSLNQDFSESLAKTWTAHNINDVVVSIGVGPDDTVAWTDVRSWSAQSMVNIAIRDTILDLDVLNPAQINAGIQTAVLDHYTLQDMEAFAYLKDDISLPTTTLILALIVLFVLTPLITFIFARHVDWR